MRWGGPCVCPSSCRFGGSTRLRSCARATALFVVVASLFRLPAYCAGFATTSRPLQMMPRPSASATRGVSGSSLRMVAITPALKYAVAFGSGMAISSWAHRRALKRVVRQRGERTEASPELALTASTAHVASAALKAAVELNIFTSIDALTSKGGPPTAEELSKAAGCSLRGACVLLDALSALGFLSKSIKGTYRLTPSSRLYLCGPRGISSSVTWYTSTQYVRPLWDFLAMSAVTGSAAAPLVGQESTAVQRAEQQKVLGSFVANRLASVVSNQGWLRTPARILDVGASHGMYGVALARRGRGRWPGSGDGISAAVTAIDTERVLEITARNAKAAGLEGPDYSLHTRAGNPLEVSWGDNSFDAVVLGDILHSSDRASAEKLLSKSRRALVDGGHLYIVTQLAREDRTDVGSALLSVELLAHTAEGSALRESDLTSMCQKAGFRACEVMPLKQCRQSVFIAHTLSRRRQAAEGEEDTSHPAPRNEARGASGPAPDWKYPMELSEFLGVLEEVFVSAVEGLNPLAKNPFEDLFGEQHNSHAESSPAASSGGEEQRPDDYS